MLPNCNQIVNYWYYSSQKNHFSNTIYTKNNVYMGGISRIHLSTFSIYLIRNSLSNDTATSSQFVSFVVETFLSSFRHIVSIGFLLFEIYE